MGFVSDSGNEELMTGKQYTPFLGRYKNNFRRRNLKDLPPCAWGGPIVDYFRNPLVLSQLNIDPNPTHTNPNSPPKNHPHWL